ncbi:MAG: response regulator [Burkholderiales bacterium]|nr:response regulator [Burkholderiales bacterium]
MPRAADAAHDDQQGPTAAARRIDSLPPLTLAPEASDDPLVQREFDAQAALGLNWFTLAIGVLVLSSAVALWLRGQSLGLVLARTGGGLAMLAICGLGWWLRRAGHHRGTSLLSLAAMQAATLGFAAISGQGLALPALGAVSMLIALTGVLLDLRAATLMALINLLGIGALYVGEQNAWIVHPVNTPAVSGFGRVVSHAFITFTGMAAAIVLSRGLTRTLRRSLTQERRLGQLLRLGSDWVWEMTPDGLVKSLSPSFEHHSGRSVAEFLRVGLPGGPVVVDDADWRITQAALRQRQPFRDSVISYRCSDGATLSVKASGEAVFDARGRFLGWWGVGRNVTAEVLAQRELAEARVQAEAASRAKSAFLASMSHEIRTPLNGVVGLARLLQDPALDDAKRTDYLRYLRDSAEGLAGIVSDVLDLTKIEAGRLSVEQIVFDLPELVERSFGTFATLGRERGLAFHCRVGPEVPRLLLGDPVRLRQILSNYLSNALKFTPHGSVTLEMTAPAPGRVRIAVRDTGVGVAPDAQQRLFQAFEQADGSTTRRFGGTGLGLSICRELASLMGGAVGVDSDGRYGSSFWVELPLAPPPVDQAPPAPAGLAAAQPLNGMRLLVAEDNPVNMLIVVALLERLGAQVTQAHDGHQVLATARAAPNDFDAVLMDLHMPELDGLHATRALRAEAATAALPVIALSAAVLASERQQALAAGMRDFIAKPVDEAELVRVLSRVLVRPR